MHRRNLVGKVIPNPGSGVIASAKDTERCSTLPGPDPGGLPASEDSTHQPRFRTGKVPKAAESKTMTDFEIAGAGVGSWVEWINNVDGVSIRLVGNPVVVVIPAVITGQAESFRKTLLQ